MNWNTTLTEVNSSPWMPPKISTRTGGRPSDGFVTA